VYPPTKIAPWNHQIEAWPLIKNNPAFYLAHEMGCGKSKLVVDSMSYFKPPKNLIICPKKVIDVWPKQFEIHGTHPVEIHAMKNGTIAEKAIEIDHRIRKSNGQCQVFIINFEACFRSPMGPTLNEKRRVTSPGILLKHVWDTLTVDEAHRIKSPGGKASWQVSRIAKRSKRKLFLSGTPMPHSPLDAYAQYRALNPRVFGTNFARFRARYAIMGGYLGKQIFEFQNLEDFNKRFFSCAHEVLADNVLDLPPKIDREINYDLKPRTMQLYKTLEKDLIAEVDQKEITAANVLVKMLRLAQITTGILKLDDGTEKIIDTGKVDRIIDFLEDLPFRTPVAIYYKFTPEGNLLKKEIKKTGRTVSMVSGKTDQLAEWQAGKTNVIILQIDAGSEGIDLTRTQYCIYSSTGIKLGPYRQSRRRIRRPGQNQKVFYYHVINPKTSDLATMHALRDKREVVDFVLRGLHKYKQTGIAPKTRKIRGLALSQLLGI